MGWGTQLSGSNPGATIYCGFGESNLFPPLSVKLDHYKMFFSIVVRLKRGDK